MRPSRSAVRPLRLAATTAAATAPSSTPFICQRCCRLSRRRWLSSAAALRRGLGPDSASAPKTQPPPLPPTPPPASGITALTSRRLISVSGPDAARYLQGAITSNILAPDRRPRARGFYSAFLHAQGRVLHDVFIYPDATRWGGDAPEEPGSSFLIEVDAEQADVLARHIRRYKLRARFNVRLLDGGEGRVWHVWDDGGGASPPSCPVVDLEALTSGGPEGRRGREQAVIEPVLDPRFPGRLDARVITLGGEPPERPHPALAALAAQPDEGGYTVRRYLHGVAEGQREIVREHALPAESNLDATGAIDFRKGCYVGQELTIRTKHRGVVRKRILPCVLYGEGEPPPERLEYLPASPSSCPSVGLPSVTADMVPPEATIGHAGKKGRSAGKWLAGVGNVGLALCRLEVMTDVVVQEAGNAMYDPAAEFVVSAPVPAPAVGQGVEGEGQCERGQQIQAIKIKAFVPGWLREVLTAHRADGH